VPVSIAATVFARTVGTARGWQADVPVEEKGQGGKHGAGADAVGVDDALGELDSWAATTIAEVVRDSCATQPRAQEGDAQAQRRQVPARRAGCEAIGAREAQGPGLGEALGEHPDGRVAEVPTLPRTDDGDPQARVSFGRAVRHRGHRPRETCTRTAGKGRRIGATGGVENRARGGPSRELEALDAALPCANNARIDIDGFIERYRMQQRARLRANRK